jgi:hypothetical protein
MLNNYRKLLINTLVSCCVSLSAVFLSTSIHNRNMSKRVVKILHILLLCVLTVIKTVLKLCIPFYVTTYILRNCRFPIVDSEKQVRDQSASHLATSFMPLFPLPQQWSTLSWALGSTSSVWWWNTSQTLTTMCIIVGWFKFWCKLVTNGSRKDFFHSFFAFVCEKLFSQVYFSVW